MSNYNSHYAPFGRREKAQLKIAATAWDRLIKVSLWADTLLQFREILLVTTRWEIFDYEQYERYLNIIKRVFVRAVCNLAVAWIRVFDEDFGSSTRQGPDYRSTQFTPAQITKMHMIGNATAISRDRWGPIPNEHYPHPETESQIRISKAWVNLKIEVNFLNEILEGIRVRGVHSDEAIKCFTSKYPPSIARSTAGLRQRIVDKVDELREAIWCAALRRRLVKWADVPEGFAKDALSGYPQ